MPSPPDHQGPPQITGSWLIPLAKPFETPVTVIAHPFCLMKSLTLILDNFDNLKLHPLPKVIGPLLGILLLLPPPSIRQSAPIWKQQRQRKCSTGTALTYLQTRRLPSCARSNLLLLQLLPLLLLLPTNFCWIATFAITFPTYSTLFTYSIANCLLFAGLPARARRVQAPWAVRRPFRQQPAVIGHILHCRLWPVWRPKNQHKIQTFLHTQCSMTITILIKFHEFIRMKTFWPDFTIVTKLHNLDNTWYTETENKQRPWMANILPPAWMIIIDDQSQS